MTLEERSKYLQAAIFAALSVIEADEEMAVITTDLLLDQAVKLSEEGFEVTRFEKPSKTEGER